MASSFSRSLLGALTLAFQLHASDVAPSVPLVPPPSPTTNTVVVPFPFLKQTIQEPYLSRSFREMMAQRLSERMLDPFTPRTLVALSESATAYHDFAQDTGAKILLGSGRRVAQDLLAGRVLPHLSFGTGKFSDWIDGLTYGSIHGPQGRDQRPLTSVYYAPQDLLFTPKEEHPRHYSWSIDPFRTDPQDNKIGGTMLWRRGSRVLRGETSARFGQLSLDIHDSIGLLRFGGQIPYENSMQSSLYISFVPRSPSFPSLTVQGTPRGNTTFSLSYGRSF